MVAIFSWGKDLLIQPAESVRAVHDLKRRLSKEDTEYIIYEGHLLCPLRLDIATRELDEEEQLEWLMTEVYPQLESEGRISRKNGRFVPLRARR